MARLKMYRRERQPRALHRRRVSGLGDRRLSALRAGRARHGDDGRGAVRPVRARVRRRHRALRRGRHLRRSAARRLSQRGRAAAMAGRPPHLEHGRTSRGSIATSGRSCIGPTSSASSATSSASRTSRTTSSSAGCSIRTSCRCVPKYVDAAGRRGRGARRPADSRTRARWRPSRGRSRSASSTTSTAACSTIRTGRCGAICSACCASPARRTNSRSRTRSAAGCTTCR